MATLSCAYWKNYFASKRGLTIHVNLCMKNTKMKAAPLKFEVRFKWGKHNDKGERETINNLNEKTAYWKKNMFILPTGKVGTLFIKEMAKLLVCFCRWCYICEIAFPAIL